MKAPKNQKMETLYATYGPISKTQLSPRRFNFSLIYNSMNHVQFHFLHLVVIVTGDGTVFA
jgi:hypothetical protein